MCVFYLFMVSPTQGNNGDAPSMTRSTAGALGPAQGAIAANSLGEAWQGPGGSGADVEVSSLKMVIRWYKL